MAASAGSRRYVSAVYEDKYFPEKNAAIPFKWETCPGKPKYDNIDENDDDDEYECAESYTLRGATSIYPLRPPPKVSPAKPLHVKDLLLNAGCPHDHALSDDPFDEDCHCPLQTYRHGSFSRLSIRFRSLKASTVVPVGKDRCVTKQSGLPAEAGMKASPLLVAHGAQALHGRSQSFNHGAGVAAKVQAAKHNDVIGDSSMHASSRRRCNSFHLHPSAHHSAIHHDINKAQDDDDDASSMAVAAVWAGACMLAAAAVHDVVSTDHHQHGPCNVAMKLKDLMQQSTNFSELELPMMMKLKKGGGNVIDEKLAQLALCHATITPAARRKTEEQATDAVLREAGQKSCTHDADVEDEPLKEKVTHEGDDQFGKLVKRKRFLKVFKNECIACWCPSPTLY